MATVDIKNGKVVGYVTPKEFGERFGVDDQTVRQWIHRGLLDILKIGDRSYIKENTERPTHERGT